MSFTSLFANVPNIAKVLSLATAVGGGTAAVALQDAPAADLAPIVQSALAESSAEPSVDEASGKGPGHATGLDRAEERAPRARGHERARAAQAAAAERRASRGEHGRSAEARAAAAERMAQRGERPSGGEEARLTGAERRAAAAERRAERRAERPTGPRGGR